MNGSLLFREVFLPGVWTLEATTILSVAWLIAHFTRRNAALRHLIRLTAFAALPLIPVANALIPARYSLSVPLPSSHGTPQSEAPADELTRYVAVLQPSMPARMGLNVSPRVSPAETSETAPATPSRFDGTSVMRCLFGVWLAGVTVVLLQGVCALYGLRRLRRRSLPGGTALGDSAELADRLGLRRRWELRVSVTKVPPSAMTWGFFRPVVLLPRDSADWSDEQWEAVLLHELAHVRRGDSLSQLFTLGVCALYWFHPAVWRCARAMQADAEMAADDTVLRSGLMPSKYAAELLRFASQRGPQRQPFVRIGVSMLKQSRIESRIQSIVNPTHRRGVTPMETLKVVGCSLVGVLLLALARPSVSLADNRAAVQKAAVAQESAEEAKEALVEDVQVSQAKPADTAIAVVQQSGRSRAGKRDVRVTARAARQAPVTVVASPAQLAKPGDVARPTQVSKPAAVARPTQVVSPAEVARPVEVAKPAAIASPAQVASPVEVAKPAPVARPVQVARPADVARPREVVEPEPEVDVKPAAVAAPQEVAKPEIIVKRQKTIKRGTAVTIPVEVKRHNLKPETIQMPVEVVKVRRNVNLVSSPDEAKPVIVVKRSQPVKVDVNIKPQAVLKPSVNSSTNVILKPSVNTSTNVVLKPSVNTSTNVILKPSVNGSTNVILKPSVNRSTNVILKPSVNGSTNVILKPSVNVHSNVVVKPSVVDKKVKIDPDNKVKPRVDRFDAWGDPK